MLRGYKVAYKLHPSGKSLQYLNVNNPSSTTTDVTGLGKYTEYSVQVIAFTVKDGSPSDAKVIRTQEDGKQPFHIVIYLCVCVHHSLYINAHAKVTSYI